MEGFVRPELVPNIADATGTDSLSPKFACLSCDFFISRDGTAKGLSYINNIHLCYSALYCRFEELLSKCVPMFDHDLDADNQNKKRNQGTSSSAKWPLYSPAIPSIGLRLRARSGGGLYTGRLCLMSRLQVTRVGWESVKMLYNLGGGLSKSYMTCTRFALYGGLAFQGSQWRTEGMKNERIVACILYNSSSENITHNSIEFRMALKTPSPFPWIKPCRYIRAVPIRQGVCIAYPNMYQPHITPFSLVDPSKEGHQRIVGLYLVDPGIAPLTSTQGVPPPTEGVDEVMSGEGDSWNFSSGAR
ncbi:hypothetical protein BDR07DRAFT_640846 [Suillus spraguei]|nr:hypothetical protein BDR07DRAFT_640846 [Suillus spraguei]